MIIKGIIRGLQIDRKRLLIERTPLIITYPTVPKKEIIEKIIERLSVGAGGQSAGTQKTVKVKKRSSSSTSITTKISTSKKSSASQTVIPASSPSSSPSAPASSPSYQPPVSYSSGGCSLNKY